MADKTLILSRFAGNTLFIWIPACAGMTMLLSIYLLAASISEHFLKSSEPVEIFHQYVFLKF